MSYGQLHLEPTNKFSYATGEVVAHSQLTLFPLMIFTFKGSMAHFARIFLRMISKPITSITEIVLEQPFLAPSKSPNVT